MDRLAELYPVALLAELPPVALLADLSPVALLADLYPVACSASAGWQRVETNSIAALMIPGRSIEAFTVRDDDAILLSSECLAISPVGATTANTEWAGA